MTNEEAIVRFCYLPSQINEDGSLKPTAIPKSDLERPDPELPPPRGLSVYRLGHCTAEELSGWAERQHKSKPEERAEVWAYDASVGSVRALVDRDGDRAVCVVDRTVEGEHAHAECWGSKKRSRAALSEVRDRLAQELTRSDKLFPSATDVTEMAGPPTPSSVPSQPARTEVTLLKPSFYSLVIGLRGLLQGLLPRSEKAGASFLFVNSADSVASHALQADGRKLTKITVRGWTTNGSIPLHATLVTIMHPLWLPPSGKFTVTVGDAAPISSGSPAEPGERREVIAHFEVGGFVGRLGRPLRLVLGLRDNVGRWHRWVCPALVTN